jgi:RNA polymerase sigma factor (TIGR02999 family)
MTPPQPDVTTLLGLAGRGDARAKEALFRLVEAELRRCAAGHMRRERHPHDLQTTVLVDDAFLRLVGNRGVTWESRSQFYCLAAKAMRQILVDEARRAAAQKRGGGARTVQLEQAPEPAALGSIDPLTRLALDEALTELARTHPELEQIVELHHFGGWDLKQIADDVLHVPYPTVKKWWTRAKARLHRALYGNTEDA